MFLSFLLCCLFLYHRAQLFSACTFLSLTDRDLSLSLICAAHIVSSTSSSSSLFSAIQICFFFPFFLCILYIFLICFFLGLYIVTTFWVTPFSFLYCKHCFTPSLFLLLLLWHFYGLITDLSFFLSFFRDKRLMTFMLELYVLLLFWLTGE